MLTKYSNSEQIIDELYELRFTLDNVGAYIFIKDIYGRYTYANSLVQKLFGLPLECIKGKKDEDFFDLHRSNELRENDRIVLKEGKYIEKEERNYIIESRQEKIYWTVKKPIIKQRKIVGICGISTDITEHRRLENERDKYWELANRDALTGIYSRRYILELVEKQLYLTNRRNSKIGLFVVDLDHFKSINDTHGHVFGDKYIQHVVNACDNCLREGDVMGRLGGDEFLIMVNSDEVSINHIAERILTAVKEIKLLSPNGTHIKCSISLGAALSDRNSTKDELIKKADTALYQAKSAGRGKWCLHDKLKDTHTRLKVIK